MLGRNLAKEIPIQKASMLNLYTHKPQGKPIYIPLKANGVQCYSYSDHEAIANWTWWVKGGFIPTKLPFLLEEVKNSWFLLYHTFHLHGPENPKKLYQGKFKKRQRFHEEYNKKVGEVFRGIILPLMKQLQPLNFAIMGDHGEEFFDEHLDNDVKLVGHGDFEQAITTDNVRYTVLFVNSNRYSNVDDYHKLYRMILDWYS